MAQTVAQAVAYRAIDQERGFLGALSHTAGLVEKQTVKLIKLPTGTYQIQMTVPPREPGGEATTDTFSLDGEWDLAPHDVDLISRQVHTMLTEGESVLDVLKGGEFAGEDIPLYCFELNRRKASLMGRLFGTGGGGEPGHPGEGRRLRLAFEDEQEAMEWYSLASLACGYMAADHPTDRKSVV